MGLIKTGSHDLSSLVGQCEATTPSNDTNVSSSPILSVAAIRRILGIKAVAPLTPTEMAESLRVAFYPVDSCSVRLSEFLNRLRLALLKSGAKLIEYEDALRDGKDGRIGKGTVLFATGEGEPGNLAIDHVASLSQNTVVGVLEGSFKKIGESDFQRRVDTLVGALVWHMVHVVIYVDDSSWTICNMNGAIDTFSHDSLQARVFDTLIPKLAAPVIPPQKSDFEISTGAFDPFAPEFELNVHDLVAGSESWGRLGLLASQTRLDSLRYRSPKYKRIANAYLSWRTGMSYGFLGRQLPMAIRPALELGEVAPILRRLDWEEKDFLEIDGELVIAPKIGKHRFLVRIRSVSVLCTRSGCEKIKLNPATDLVVLSLDRGRTILETAVGLPDQIDCQPSFDATTILAHAVGNAIVATVLSRINSSSKFMLALSVRGLALAHWHGFIDRRLLPSGYYLYGYTNPPVSCSTPQAAIFALAGKLSALQTSLVDGAEYLGDVHVEPSHGTNINGRSLGELAQVAAGE